MTTENKREVLSTVKNQHVHSSTNSSAAIAVSFQELRSVTTPNKIRRIFLLIDGNADRYKPPMSTGTMYIRALTNF